MRFTSSIGMIVLSIYLILEGVSMLFGLGIPALIFGILALVAGVLLLIGK